MAANPRHTFPLAELVRIRSGKNKIAAIHNNWCPTLIGKTECSCGDSLEYRLITVREGVYQR
jgi:hypothetical protein